MKAEPEACPTFPVQSAPNNGSDSVMFPSHYRLPCGIEVITITADLSFCLGSAVKYLLRAGKKGPAVEDLRKAARMIQYEIQRLETGRVQPGILP